MAIKRRTRKDIALDRIKSMDRCSLNCNLFSIYDYDGYSMQELLCQFFTKINELADSVNTTLDLVEWLVNEGLELAVVEQLEIWLNDGTLAEIINETLFNELNAKIDNAIIRIGDNETNIANNADNITILQQDIQNLNEHNNLQDENIQSNTDNITVLENFKKRFIFVDDFPTVQDCLNEAKNTPFPIVCFGRNKTYTITDGLTFDFGNVTFEGNGSVITTTNPNIRNMFVNGTLGASYSRYNGNGNIHIKNLTFIGYLNTTDSAIAFAHGKNIKIENCVFLNFKNHAVDSAGNDGLKILNCKFYGCTGYYDDHLECIQIDCCVESGFSLFGDNDGTPTKNVLIENCEFLESDTYPMWEKCVGSHTMYDGLYYENIIVRNCKMKSSKGIVFKQSNVRNLHVYDNEFDTANYGIEIYDAPESFGYAKYILENIFIYNNSQTNNNCLKFVTIQHEFNDMLNIKIYNNLSDVSNTGIEVRDISSTKTLNLNYVQIFNNSIIGRTDNVSGIYVDRLTRGKVMDNVLTDIGKSGIIHENCLVTDILRNKIERVKEFGIKGNNSSFVNINNNVIKDTGLHGIIYGLASSNIATGMVISGNTIENCGYMVYSETTKRPIELYKVSYGIVKDNIITNPNSIPSVNRPDTGIAIGSTTDHCVVSGNIVTHQLKGDSTNYIWDTGVSNKLEFNVTGLA